MDKLQFFIDWLGLTKPVNLTYTTRNPKKWDAFYLPQYKGDKLTRHNVTISVHSHRNHETLLMHELIHAWQEENKKTEIHGKHFRKLAKRAEKTFSLTGVYLKGTDK